MTMKATHRVSTAGFASNQTVAAVVACPKCAGQFQPPRQVFEIFSGAPVIPAFVVPQKSRAARYLLWALDCALLVTATSGLAVWIATTAL